MSKKEKAYFYLGNNLKNCLGTADLENQYDNVEYIYDINNQNDAHASVARIITNNSKVLDVGCATGITGKLLHDFKNCEVDGIELDKKAIEISKQKGCYKKLYNFSITDCDNKIYKQFFDNNDTYDYIVFCDVLEHLPNPDTVLLNFLKKLKKNGKIIVSVPNIANIDIIRALINGEFNYAPLGILDRTHLRFFSTASFVEMIENISEKEAKNLYVNICDQIKIRPIYVQGESELLKLFNINGDLEKFLVIQNIFEIGYSNNKKVNNLQKFDNNHDYFELINDYLTEEKHKEWNTIGSLNAEIDRLRKHESKFYKLKRVLQKNNK